MSPGRDLLLAGFSLVRSCFRHYRTSCINQAGHRHVQDDRRWSALHCTNQLDSFSVNPRVLLILKDCWNTSSTCNSKHKNETETDSIRVNIWTYYIPLSFIEWKAKCHSDNGEIRWTQWQCLILPRGTDVQAVDSVLKTFRHFWQQRSLCPRKTSNDNNIIMCTTDDRQTNKRMARLYTRRVTASGYIDYWHSWGQCSTRHAYIAA